MGNTTIWLNLIRKIKFGETYQLMLGEHKGDSVYIWIALKTENSKRARLPFFFCMGLMHYSWDPQVQISANFSLKLGFMALFTHLKIILL